MLHLQISNRRSSLPIFFVCHLHRLNWRKSVGQRQQLSTLKFSSSGASPALILLYTMKPCNRFNKSILKYIFPLILLKQSISHHHTTIFFVELEPSSFSTSSHYTDLCTKKALKIRWPQGVTTEDPLVSFHQQTMIIPLFFKNK